MPIIQGMLYLLPRVHSILGLNVACNGSVNRCIERERERERRAEADSPAVHCLDRIPNVGRRRVQLTSQTHTKPTEIVGRSSTLAFFAAFTMSCRSYAMLYYATLCSATFPHVMLWLTRMQRNCCKKGKVVKYPHWSYRSCADAKPPCKGNQNPLRSTSTAP